VTNHGSEDLTASRVQISWPASQGRMKKVKLGGADLWEGLAHPTSIDIDSGWDQIKALTLSADDEEEFKIEFKDNDKTDRQADYAITLHFAQGCSISF
jgi:hypothetical protein